MAETDDYEVRPTESATWYLAQLVERLKAIEKALATLCIATPVMGTIVELTAEPIDDKPLPPAAPKPVVKKPASPRRRKR